MDGAPLLLRRQSLLPSDHRGTASQAIKALEASGYLVRQRSKADSKLPGDCALSKRGGRNLEVSGTFAAEIARQSLYPAIGARPDGGGAGARPIRHRPSCAAALYDDLRRRAPARAAGARAGAGTAIRRARRADRRTSRSRARLSSLASVGNITAFGCTVVSITTRARSDAFIASVRVATAKLSCSSALSFSCPIRWRQRVSDERSNTNACWKNSSPQKYWKYGFSTQRSHRASSERS